MDNTNILKCCTVLVVDDTPDNLSLMSDLLKDHYKVKVANNGHRCMKIAKSETPPDIILLDIMMPEFDGYKVCKELKSDDSTKDIPIIFLTAKSDAEDERYGLELGAVDYITKPISPSIVLARVATHLRLKESSDFLKDKNHFLESEIEKRTQEIMAVQEVTIFALASLAEARDNDTGNHIMRTRLYVKTLAIHLKNNDNFKEFLTENNIQLLYKSAPLHDIGKVGIPDNILLKPGSLTPEEFEIMKKHSEIGWSAIVNAEKSLGTNVDFLKIAKEIALHHHEKWDGSGYPHKLSGRDIPVSARLMALADFYDALTTKRVYRNAMPHDIVVKMIEESSGKHFDPDVVAVFFEHIEEFKAIFLKYLDS